MSNQLRGPCPSAGTRSSSKALSPYKQPIALYRKITSLTTGKLSQSIDAKLIVKAEKLKLEQDFQKNFSTEAFLKYLANCSKSGNLSQQLSLFENVSTLKEGWKSMLYAMDLNADRQTPQQDDTAEALEKDAVPESNEQTTTQNKAAETGVIGFDIIECSIADEQVSNVSLCMGVKSRKAARKQRLDEDMELVKAIAADPALMALIDLFDKYQPRRLPALPACIENAIPHDKPLMKITRQLVQEVPAIDMLKSSVNDYKGSGDGIHVVMIYNENRKSSEDEYDAEDSLLLDLRVVPMESDFRNYFELDIESLSILSRYANMSIHCSDLDESQAAADNFKPDRRITYYLVYLYRLRIIQEFTTLHAAIKEGLFAAQTLTQQPNLLNSLLSKSQQPPNRSKLFAAHLKLEKLHKAEPRSQQKSESMAINGLTAYYMVTSYLQVLLENAKNKSMPILERHLFLSHYAVAALERHIISLNEDVSPANISCKRLLIWCFLKEISVKNSLNMALSIANLRSKLSTADVYALRMPNPKAYLKFMLEQQLPYPEKLGIDPRVPRIRRYELAEHNFPFEYYCPIAGCTAALCASNFMAHFVTDHCSRVEELWLYDRTMLIFHKQCYAQDQNHCISVLALLPRKPIRMVNRPLRVLNYQLPTSQLYFAEHWPCMLMYRSMYVNTHGPGTEPTLVDFFWVASINEFPLHLGVTLNISINSKALDECFELDVVHMSDFRSEEHLLRTDKHYYVAFAQGTIEQLTNNFEEMLFINVRYIHKDEFVYDFEENEKAWDNDDLKASGLNIND